MYGHQNTVINRLKYIISEFEPAQFRKQIADLFDTVSDNFKKNEIKLLQDQLPDFKLKKFLDYKKITFDQIERLSFEYRDLKLETKYNQNMYFIKLITDKYFSNSSPEQHEEYAKNNIDIKFLALAKRLCESKPVISVNLINLYFGNVNPKLIVKVINANYLKIFNFSNSKNELGVFKLLPDEVNELIISFVYSNLNEMIQHFPYQNYFDMDEYKVLLSGE